MEIEAEKDLETMIIKGQPVGYVDASIYPKDGSRFELSLITVDGVFFFPLAYWNKEAAYFTAETPEGWYHSFTLTLHPTPDAQR